MKLCEFSNALLMNRWFSNAAPRLGAILWAAGCAAMLSACAGPEAMTRLDREARQILEARQDVTLGPQTSRIDQPVPVSGGVPADGSAYRRAPSTINPPADALDLTRGPRSGPQPYPNLLDDGSDPRVARLNLEGLLAFAIAHSPQYKRQKEALFLATLALIIERHAWGPRFFSAVTGRLTGQPEGGDTDTASALIASLGVTQRLPYGGSVSAVALVDYVSYLRRSTDNDAPTAQSFGIELGLDLPLLRGAGPSAPTSEGRLQAERDLIYAVRDFERYRRGFLVDLATTYFGILSRQRQLANREQQLDSLEALTERFQALAEAGRVATFQAERAEQRALFRRNALLNQQENYALALDRLKLQIGMDILRPLEVLAVSIDIPLPRINVEEAVATAMDNRLDLQTQRDLVEDAKRQVRIARNQLLPDLDLEADVILPSNAQESRPGFDVELSDGEYVVDLTLGIPLDRDIEQAQYRAALIGFERQRRDFLTASQEVELDVRAAIRNIERAFYSIGLQQRNVEIAERRVEGVELDQRNLGSKEAIDAQEDLLDARNARDQARSELQASILQFLLQSGQMRVGPDGRWKAPGGLVTLSPDAAEQGAGFPIAPPPSQAPAEEPRQ